MTTIKIEVEGNELETITVELSQEEVKSLYQLRKELNAKISELQKELENLKTSKKYCEEREKEYSEELTQVHSIFSALGVAEKTNEEEAYYRKPLKAATRLALYLAGNK